MLPINTVAVYDNIHLPKVQKQIQIDIKYRSNWGCSRPFYCFQHKVSGGKLYIGSSFKLWTRFFLGEHVFGYKSNVHLQNAFIKYGLSGVCFHCIRVFWNNRMLHPLTNNENSLLLMELEQKSLSSRSPRRGRRDLLNPEYNISKTALLLLY